MYVPTYHCPGIVRTLELAGFQRRPHSDWYDYKTLRCRVDGGHWYLYHGSFECIAKGWTHTELYHLIVDVDLDRVLEQARTARL